MSGTCTWYMFSQAAESGRGHGGRGWAGRGDEKEKQTRSESESGDWLPAQDDFQLAAVELPSVGQTHDALLVARQALHVYLLEDRADSPCQSNENRKGFSQHVSVDSNWIASQNWMQTVN